MNLPAFQRHSLAHLFKNNVLVAAHAARLGDLPTVLEAVIQELKHE